MLSFFICMIFSNCLLSHAFLSQNIHPCPRSPEQTAAAGEVTGDLGLWAQHHQGIAGLSLVNTLNTLIDQAVTLAEIIKRRQKHVQERLELGERVVQVRTCSVHLYIRVQLYSAGAQSKVNILLDLNDFLQTSNFLINNYCKLFTPDFRSSGSPRTRTRGWTRWW